MHLGTLQLIIKVTILFLFIARTHAATNSRYHNYRIDPDCDVASSTFIPYTGIRIQQSFSVNHLQPISTSPGQRFELPGRPGRLLRANVCLHGASYAHSYANYTTSSPGSDWIDWSVKFCLNSINLPPWYNGCFVMDKMAPAPDTVSRYPQALAMLFPDNPVGVLYQCAPDGKAAGESSCDHRTPIATLLTDEPYMAVWDRPRKLPDDPKTTVRVPLLYTAEPFSEQHFRGSEFPVLSTYKGPGSTSMSREPILPDKSIVRHVLSMVDRQLGTSMSETFSLEHLSSRLLEVYLLEDKRRSQAIVEALARFVMSRS